MSSLTVEEIFQAAELACQNSDLPRMSKLLDQWTFPAREFAFDDSISSRRLEFATSKGHTFLMKNLLEQDLEITWLTVVHAAKCGSIDVFQTLLDHGWDINSYPDRTSLRYAYNLPI